MIAFLEHRCRRRLAPGTIELSRTTLRRFVGFCRGRGITTPQAVTAELVDTFVVDLRTRRQSGGWARGRRLSPRTVAMIVSHVCLLFGFLVREGHLLADPTSQLATKPAGPRLELERAVTLAELDAMIAVCDPATALGVRDRAMLELLFGTGLRRAEMVALDLYDLDLRAGTVFVRSGKGGASRLVPVAGQARRALRRYLDRGRPALITSRTNNALFLGVRGQRIGGGRVHQIVGECAHRAGLARRIGRRIGPHGFRHGFALALLRGGAGIHAVQRLLGHARVDTTELYTALTLDDVREVHRRTHPRERGRGRGRRGRRAERGRAP